MAKKKAHKAQKRPQKAAAPAAAVTAVSAPISTPMEAPVLSEMAKPEEKPEAQVEPQSEAPKRKPISIGIWAYFIGIILAFAAAIFISDPLKYYTYAALAIIGIMVGLLNIRDDEILLFLVASVAFVISSLSIRTVIETTPIVSIFLANIIVFTAASAFIVSLKALVRVARDE